ncbi:helix-turn-helix domain-containing protein [Eubacterium sp.]
MLVAQWKKNKISSQDAADILGISRSTFFNRMKKAGV